MFSAWDAEKKRNFVIGKLSKPMTYRNKVFILCDYFEDIISSGDEQLINSYLPEFMDDLIRALHYYDPYYIPIKKTERVVALIQSLDSYLSLKIFHQEIENNLINILADLGKLEGILKGKDYYHSGSKLLFPVLEVNGNCYAFGMLDSLTIQVSKNNEHKFIIIPSEIEIEENLNQQISDSWKAAINYCRNRIYGITQNYKVIIQFDKRAGVYVGNSLGVVLTIGFIEQLLDYYNAPYLVSVNGRTAITGGMKSNGAILRVGKEEIEKKTEIIFYSPVHYFAVPKEDEQFAKNKLKELKKEYPERNLRIIPIEHFDDLPDRRTIVDIKKQNSIVRLAKTLRKNYITAILIAIIVMLSGYYVIRDYDDNPAIFKVEGNHLLIENKKGKLLWSKKVFFDPNYVMDENYRNQTYMAVDINNDKKIELLLLSEFNSLDQSILSCYNYKGERIWSYKFTDSVLTVGEKIPRKFSITRIIGLRDSILYLTAGHQGTFPSAVFKLNAKTGKRLTGTLWSAGHFYTGTISDFDMDNKEELYLLGISNSYEQVFFTSIDLNFADSQCLYDSTMYPYKFHYYKFINMPFAQFKFFILIPRSDYNIYLKYRNNLPALGGLSIIDKYLEFAVLEDVDNSGIGYKFSSYNKDLDIVISSFFKVRRDTLVAKGVLSLPYTDTEEYKNILKSQVLYWNGERFVKREELK